jgi:hypothetical protein
LNTGNRKPAMQEILNAFERILEVIPDSSSLGRWEANMVGEALMELRDLRRKETSAPLPQIADAGCRELDPLVGWCDLLRGHNTFSMPHGRYNGNGDWVKHGSLGKGKP